MGGSSTAPAPGCEPGVYGTQGTPAAANVPGSRSLGATWTDASGNLWLFGGGGCDSNANQGSLNDLWRFSPATNQWTWIGGSSTIYQSGIYGTKGTPEATNIPPSRECAVSWMDANGHLWLFGGEGSVSNGSSYFLNDLWEFDPTSSQWTWVGGSSAPYQSGVYGTQGTPAAANMPGARSLASTWKDANGHFCFLAATAAMPPGIPAR